MSGRNPPNPAIWLVPRAGGILRSCPLTRAESLAALLTSLFVVCEWAKTVIFTMTLAIHCARPRMEANCRCDVSFERPLVTSRPRAWSYLARERKLWWKKFKIKRFPSGCDKIWDSRSIEGKDSLATDPQTVFWLVGTIFMGFMELRAGTVGFRVPSLPIFLTVSTTQNFKRR